MPTFAAAQPEPLLEPKAVATDSTDLSPEVRAMQPATTVAAWAPPNLQLLSQHNIDSPKPLLKLDIS